MDRWKFFRRRPKAAACPRSKRECKIEMELRSIEYDQALLEPLAPGIDARIIRLETLLEMKRAANRRKDLADLAALEKIAPYKK